MMRAPSPLVAFAAVVVAVIAGTGCPPEPGPEGDEGEGEPGGEGEGEAGEGEGEGAALANPTKGSSIVVDEAGTVVIVANKATDDVTLFDVSVRAAPVELARVTVGDEPVSVSLSASGTLYVVNRADGTVSEVTAALTAAPVLGRVVEVGPEPVQAAISPSGARLYVSSWVTGKVTIVDTASMTVTSTIDLGGSPYGVCITNDGDGDDDDETVFVTDFYSRPIVAPGLLEGDDASRFGRVFKVNAADESFTALSLQPVISSEVPTFEASGMFPNQLSACAINNGRVYVSNVGASPEGFNGTTDFHQNVQGLVSVLDALTGEELPDSGLNLNAAIALQTAPKRFAAIPVDIAFVPGSEIGYALSMSSDAAYRVDFATEPVVGSLVSNFLPTGKSPTGIAVVVGTAWTYNEVSRSITAINLADQASFVPDVAAAPQPTDPAEISALKGQRFFNTGLARWSNNAWVACAACHPGGLTDNVTWAFPTGPRQSIDMAGTWSADGGKQRILNWTAIFDEVHDFELNTRGVAGGTGAIVSDVALNADGTANVAVRVDITGNDFNLGSAEAKADASATPNDWDEIEEYLISVRTPRGDDTDEAAVARGRELFGVGGGAGGRCDKCHGGELWTLSERYYEPVEGSNFTNLTLASQGIPDNGSADGPAIFSFLLPTNDMTALNMLANDVAGGPARHTCVVRKVGTFGVDGPEDRGAAELRVNGTAAQGADGYNVPSLLGLARGAPYLHHGGAETLDELLDPNGDFRTHLRAGNLNFTPTVEQTADLVAFLKSIDDETETFEVPANQIICPAGLTLP